MTTTVTLPLPPTTNRLRLPKGGRLITTREYRAWQEEALWALHKQGFVHGGSIEYPQPMQLTVKLTVHRETNHVQDIDNRSKGSLDICSGLIYEDDSQIQLLIIERGEKKQPGSVVVEVKEWGK
tara:strand:+ start:42 stop:413 length:372 start_codon:yes stop_codon:yes gene_type:complete